MDTARSPSSSDYERDVKRQKPSTSRIVTSSAMPSGKLFIIYVCKSENDECVNISVVDPNANPPSHVDEFSVTRPLLQLDCSIFYCYAFCVMDSMLYAFEGHIHTDNPDARSVFKIALPSSIEDPTRPLGILGKNDLIRACDMRRPKLLPAATPTPDGKILVFSTQNDHRKSVLEIDFELCDPIHNVWEEIPKFLIPKPLGCVTRGYTFVNECTFLILTDIGLFTLNLASLTKGWTRVDHDYAGLEGLPHGLSNDQRFFLIENKLCLTPWGAYFIRNQNGRLSEKTDFPLSCFNSCHSPLITVLDAQHGKCIFYVTDLVIDERTGHAYLILDECSFNLDEFKKTGKLELSNIGTFQFLVDDQQCEVIYGINMYSL